jgi:predicted secreted protein
MDLTYEDSGSDRAIGVGEEIELSLTENPTTGYRWEPDLDPAMLRQTHDSYEGDAEPRGAAGVRVLRFEVLQPGDVALRLVKRRKWDQKVADQFVVRLHAVAS